MGYRLINPDYILIGQNNTGLGGRNDSKIDTWLEYKVLEQNGTTAKIKVYLYASANVSGVATSFFSEENYGYIQVNNGDPIWCSATSYDFNGTDKVNKFAEVEVSVNDDGTGLPVKLYGKWTTNGHSGYVTGGYAEATITLPKYVSLDVNGLLDGEAVGNIDGYGTFDVYINGYLMASNVSDYYDRYPYGYTFEVANIQTSTGKTYLGVSSGSLSGVLTGDTTTQLEFKTNTYYFNLNILMPDGSEPWQSNPPLAGSVEISINNGAWERVSNEPLEHSYYPYGTSFRFRDFIPGTGLHLSSVTGATQNADGTWSAVQGASELIVVFQTEKNNYGLDVNAELDGVYTKVPDGRYGTFSVNINGVTVGENMVDYFDYHPYGSTYEIFKLDASKGRRYLGCNLSEGVSPSGTIPDRDIEVILQFETIHYSIGYVLGGGTNPDTAPTSYTVDDAVTLPTPTRSGYKFTGWQDEGGSIVTGIPAGATGDKTFTATWKSNNYNLTVQGYIDGKLENGILGYGLFDVYIDGEEYQLDCDDEFTASLPYGSFYEIKNIRVEENTVYKGVFAGNLSGTIDEDKIVILKFSTKAITADLNVKVKVNDQAKQGIKGVIRKNNQNKKIIRFYIKVNRVWNSK